MRVNFNQPQPAVSTEKKTVHNIVILDASGSMAGDKWNNAVKLVNGEFENLRKQNDVILTYSVVIFSDEVKIVQWKQNTPRPINVVTDYMRQGTALNDAIGETLEKLINEMTMEQVLVKILTDGEELHSKRWNPAMVREIIKQSETCGWTITFAGTEKDVKTAQRLYGVDASNTIVHDNTGRGIDELNSRYGVSTTAYFADVAQGKDVTRGFFKQINKTDD